MNKINIIVVIYNKNCVDSITCRYLLDNCTEYNITICDNSIIANTNRNFCENNSWDYIKMNGNEGISKAYNAAISMISAINSWIVLLDQDTEISNDYFYELNHSIKNYPDIYIHIPIVKDKKGILSPCSIKHNYVKRIKDSSEFQNCDRLTAINTGMVICRKVFENNFKYNEKFFLDYVDHNFIREYKKIHANIKVMNTILYQNFSDNEHDNCDADYRRFSIYKKDFKLFCENSYSGTIYYYIKIIYRAIKLSLVYKDAKFIKILFDN